MLSENTQIKNAQAIVNYLFHKINQGGGNGHFTLNADVSYYRNGKSINTFPNIEVHFENEYTNRIYMPELAEIGSPRIRADFSSDTDMMKFDGTTLIIEGGRKSNQGFGRFHVEIR